MARRRFRQASHAPTVSPATLTFTTANWDVAQTVTVSGVDDFLDDGNQVSLVTVAVDDAASDNAFDPVAGLDHEPLVIFPRSPFSGIWQRTVDHLLPRGARPGQVVVEPDLINSPEAMVRAVLGPPQRGKAQLFEDQYICSGGQLYELIAGHDRFVADLRPLLDAHMAAVGRDLGICCHPYDLATILIARKAGVLLAWARSRPRAISACSRS